ncbi:AtpZ/AtpI family protein [Pseudooceanicola aestuarii]|uniref:AtpZ/AtpI family protein n=1 Tax=Pseudooceanicola aestuarii TaxID=2697319 RepID=UPI0013D8CDA8|nr:AtpZ/AtpI family protein [Pseudooceanicola aestuarii]
MSEPDHRHKLADLDARIAAAKGAPDSEKTLAQGYSSAEVGWRMVTELVAGLGIGLGVGYGLDVLLGTLPIMLVLFTGLGFVAGIRVMMRSARDYQDRLAGAQDAPAEDEKRD